MESSTVTSKGQITIPVEIRKRMNLHAGDRVQFIPSDGGHVKIIPCKAPVSELIGMLPKPEKAATIEEMNETIRKGWAGLL